MEDNEDKKMVDLLKRDSRPILSFMLRYFWLGFVWAFDIEFLTFFPYFAFFRNKQATFWQKLKLFFLKWTYLFIK